ncbi:hypothetical protein GQ457_14G021710 [Hibiscus cannabinus]
MGKRLQTEAGGGLGFFDVGLRNRALLNKWIWQYASEKHSLWRKVIDAKYDFDSSALLPLGGNMSKFSWIWKGRSKPLQQPYDEFIGNLRFNVGNGLAINFWEDFWTELPTLRVVNRIYAMAVNKHGKLAEFGSLENVVWVWNVELRHSLFDWEVEVCNAFLDTIQKAARFLNMVDTLKWIGSSNGIYNHIEFCERVAMYGQETDPIWKLVWINLAPPKVEAFVWKTIQSRVPTRVELAKRGLVSSEQTMCAFCANKAEEVLGTWFQNDDSTPFVTAYGKTSYSYCGHEPSVKNMFNEGMASDAQLIASVLIDKCKGACEGLESLVDVGGGTGTLAKALADAFPHLDCTVLDLPHVVDGLQGGNNLKYVGGNMFEAVPAADAVILKGEGFDRYQKSSILPFPLADDQKGYKVISLFHGHRRIRVRLDHLDPWIWCNAKVVYICKGPLDVALLQLDSIPDKLSPIMVDFIQPSLGSKPYVIGHGLLAPRCASGGFMKAQGEMELAKFVRFEYCILPYNSEDHISKEGSRENLLKRSKWKKFLIFTECKLLYKEIRELVDAGLFVVKSVVKVEVKSVVK